MLPMQEMTQPGGGTVKDAPNSNTSELIRVRRIMLTLRCLWVFALLRGCGCNRPTTLLGFLFNRAAVTPQSQKPPEFETKGKSSDLCFQGHCSKMFQVSQ